MKNDFIFMLDDDDMTAIEPYATIVCQTEEDYNDIQKAIEKQIAKKPYRIHANIFHCGNDKNCDAFFTKADEYRYCPFCGTKINWSDN